MTAANTFRPISRFRGAEVDDCPFCGSTDLHAEYVDIGVGEQRVTPYQCAGCGAREFYSSDDRARATPEESAVGWWKPD